MQRQCNENKPNLATIVRSSAAFDSRLKDLGLDPNDAREGVAHALWVAWVDTLKNKLLKKHGYEVGIVSGGSMRLASVYNQLNGEGKLSQEMASRCFGEDLDQLNKIAAGVPTPHVTRRGGRGR